MSIARIREDIKFNNILSIVAIGLALFAFFIVLPGMGSLEEKQNQRILAIQGEVEKHIERLTKLENPVPLDLSAYAKKDELPRPVEQKPVDLREYVKRDELMRSSFKGRR